jgi:hypothetical protein
MQQMFDEMAKLESKGFEQARTAIDEWTRLMKEGIAYGEKLASEWRRLAIEASKRTADLYAPKAA